MLRRDRRISVGTDEMQVARGFAEKGDSGTGYTAGWLANLLICNHLADS
jgi:hypothetical protein